MMCVIDDASIWIEQRNDEYNSHYYDTEFPGLKLWQLEFALHFVMGVFMPLAQRIRTPNGPYHDCLSKHNNSSEVGTLPVLGTGRDIGVCSVHDLSPALPGGC